MSDVTDPSTQPDIVGRAHPADAHDTMLCRIKAYGRKGTTQRRLALRSPHGVTMDVEYVKRGEPEGVTHARLLARVMEQADFRGVVDHSHSDEAAAITGDAVDWSKL